MNTNQTSLHLARPCAGMSVTEVAELVTEARGMLAALRRGMAPQTAPQALPVSCST